MSTHSMIYTKWRCEGRAPDCDYHHDRRKVTRPRLSSLCGYAPDFVFTDDLAVASGC